MKKVYKDRLKKLANHLINGTLGHKKFDFSEFNRGKDRIAPEKPYSCGYAGCAIGECPIVFKRQWLFNEHSAPVLRTKEKENSEWDSGVEFFGLTHDAFRHLFVPYGQDPEAYGGRRLESKAKAKSVGNNILAFLAKQD